VDDADAVDGLDLLAGEGDLGQDEDDDDQSEGLQDVHGRFSLS
jgi:hypothetical protein